MEHDYKRFTVSLPQDLYDKFEDFRKKLGISRSGLIRKAMHSFMLHEEDVTTSSSEEVVGCITLIMKHEHFDLTHYHEESVKEAHEHDESIHTHEYMSQPIYSSVQQTDLILSNDIQHHFEDVIISTLHVHLEFDKCLEILALSGLNHRIVELKKALQKLRSIQSVGFFIVDKNP